MPVEGGEALQPRGEAREGLQRRMPLQVDPGQPDVVAVVKGGVGKGEVLEGAGEFFVGHLRCSRGN